MYDMNFRYRALTADDLAGITAVHWRACKIAYAFMNWSYSEAEVHEWYEGRFPEWDWGLVAEDGAGVVGLVAKMGTHVDQLFVDPDYQHRGIGNALMTSALQRVPTATLYVFEQNIPARRFYGRYGFREVDRFFNATEKAVELVYRRDPPIAPGIKSGS